MVFKYSAGIDLIETRSDCSVVLTELLYQSYVALVDDVEGVGAYEAEAGQPRSEHARYVSATVEATLVGGKLSLLVEGLLVLSIVHIKFWIHSI
jgi:hypothetical protein